VLNEISPGVVYGGDGAVGPMGRPARIGQMRYIVIGAGAIGGTIGGRLLESGHEVEAVCGFRAADAAVLRRRATAEGAAVLDAAGLAYASDDESAQLRGDRVRILPVNGSPRAGGSSWQSLTRGTGSIEADFLNGEIVLLGRELGVPVPVNEVLQRLANQAARQRRAPGSITPGEIMALVAA
jgi:2-dehydropantoate 2-reductase